MILPWLVLIIMIGGLLAWLSSRLDANLPRWISLAFLAVHLGFILSLWFQNPGQLVLSSKTPWIALYSHAWIPQFGISISLGLDGLSLLLVLLTDVLGIMAIVCSWNAVQERPGFFHFNLMWVLASITGVFLALDMFLFYFFWELMLVPLYFLIGIWGHENRVYATLKFFVFTQVSGLFMLLGILGLYFIHGSKSGIYTFDYFKLLGTSIPAGTAVWLMLGLFIAFAVKLPVIPVHTWLPDAHTQAPTAGSVYLAGLVLKVGAYGMLRFLVPLFPGPAHLLAPFAMALGILGILYGAALAFGQTDLKRMVAYTSVSHMGFVLLGIFAWNTLSLQGALIVMLAHGISTGALFILVGDLDERIHSRDIGQMGGLWETVPGMGGTALLLAAASLGLPGLANFVGEFLVLLGTYQVNITFAVLATLGFIVSTVYSLWMIQKVFHGSNTHAWKLHDLSGREVAVYASMIAIILWIGLFPQTVINTAQPALDAIQKSGVATQVTQVAQVGLLPGARSQATPRQAGRPVGKDLP
ncbi:MAG: NADH-quinone oxidoreductase subunit M [Anaerolineaceae bacterium]|nr:NADH-quinone oxidoreductase subunit M [Anaerolineaceae bacterium]